MVQSRVKPFLCFRQLVVFGENYYLWKSNGSCPIFRFLPHFFAATWFILKVAFFFFLIQISVEWGLFVVVYNFLFVVVRECKKQ